MDLLNGLLAWWGLHEASGNRFDSSGNGKTLVLSGTVPGVSGLLGNAASFTAKGNLLIGPVIVTAAPFSMAGWAFANDISNSPCPFSQANNAVQRVTITTSSDGSVGFRSGFGVGGFLASAAGLFTTGHWHHLAMTRDSTTLRGYLDGVLVAMATKSFTGGGTGFAVGDADPLAGGSNQWFNGLVTLLGLWSRKLDDNNLTAVGQTAGGEIARLYNGGQGLDYPLPAPFVDARRLEVFVPGGHLGEVSV